MFRCGFSETDITPVLGSIIPGQFHARYSSGIKDNLFAKAFVVSHGEKSFALISADVLFVDEETVDKVRDRVQEKCGIDKKYIMVAATHSHTAGPVCSWGDYIKKDDDYLDFFVNRLADGVILAQKNMVDAKMFLGKGFENTISFNRRYLMKDGKVATNPGIKNPDSVMPVGPIDPDVTVAVFKNMDDEIIGIISNFACHLDTVGSDEYSADYPGQISRVLKRNFSDKLVSIFLTGTCGNINHVDFSGTYKILPEHYKKMGTILAGEIIKVTERLEAVDNYDISSMGSNLNIKLRKPSEKEVENARALLEKYNDTDISILKGSSELRDTFYAKETLRIHGEKSDSTDCEVQAVRIGDLSISSYPGEIFVEYGIDLKSRSPFKYNMVASVTNGLCGYVPLRESFTQGGYEILLCATSKLDEEAGYIMTDALSDILNKI